MMLATILIIIGLFGRTNFAPAMKVLTTGFLYMGKRVLSVLHQLMHIVLFVSAGLLIILVAVWRLSLKY